MDGGDGCVRNRRSVLAGWLLALVRRRAQRGLKFGGRRRQPERQPSEPPPGLKLAALPPSEQLHPVPGPRYLPPAAPPCRACRPCADPLRPRRPPRPAARHPCLPPSSRTRPTRSSRPPPPPRPPTRPRPRRPCSPRRSTRARSTASAGPSSSRSSARSATGRPSSASTAARPARRSLTPGQSSSACAAPSSVLLLLPLCLR